ncbi:MAG: ribonuclease P protein component [Chloroflexi bacterium]|nr:ribonuclease P protein component [Chloroflexota bacterium]
MRDPGDPFGHAGRTPPATPPDRLRRRSEFALVMREGRRARHSLLHLVVRHTGAPGTRIGFSVGKRVGGAVVRNQVKRRLRMIVRGFAWRDGLDIVILAQPPAAIASFEALSGALARTSDQARILESETSGSTSNTDAGRSQ